MVNPATAPCEIDRMFPGFEKLIESRIKKAQQEGAFENLPGTGQPLPLEDDRHIPEDLRMAYKVLKNADCLPPEVQLRKEIRTTEDLLAGMTDTVQKYRTLKKLNFLILKLNALRDGNAAFDIPQRYYGEVVERLGADKV
ncbi:DnaJ family domain-containing protein [uncultured Desulfosarcina sp.]|uniref:DnaJ family domain-containing protein n=1 Tax=uncultured Desulfosarcina sp. TaxID=218289 RepID=UPI0029C762A1|nr:DnaJ family domain-containing protein [uncultured Desulfosarcina sp.]